MKKHFWIHGIILTILLLVQTTGFASDQKLPVIQGEKTVANVNGEPITFKEFNRELTSLKAGMVEEKKDEKIDSELLKRLINTRLIVQEARKIGLDEMPEVKSRVDVFGRVALRELLIERHLKNVKADQEEVDKLYKEFVKEWKINSIMLEKEDVAKKLEEEIKAGKSFDEVAKRIIADGKAKGGVEKNYLKREELLPQIANVISKMEIGSISPIIPIKSGFVITKVEDIRYPENPGAIEQVRQQALVLKKSRMLEDYTNALIKKYVKIQQDVLDRIDYESKEPGFKKLLEDRRVVAEVKGEKPITVGELTEYLRQQFYHGVEAAIESKKLNSKKVPILEELLHKRVFRKEALRLGIDKTEAYKSKVKDYENAVIFGAFLQKAVFPDIKLKEEEIKTYYNDHIGDYNFPEMVKINGLAFAKRDGAEEAVEKLRKGTEFQWLRANAEGQEDKNTKNLLRFEGRFLITKDLPESVRKVISGAKPGDIRLYASPEGYFYVLFIEDVVPAQPKPFEGERENIAKKVFDEKLKIAVEEWVDKLRAVSDIKIYLKENH